MREPRPCAALKYDINDANNEKLKPGDTVIAFMKGNPKPFDDSSPTIFTIESCGFEEGRGCKHYIANNAQRMLIEKYHVWIKVHFNKEENE